MANDQPKEKKSKARKTSDVPTKIFTIGALTKLSKDERHAPQMKVISDQIFAAFKYRRELVDIENTRRAEFRALRRKLSPVLNKQETELDRVEAELLELRRGIKAKKERSTPEQVERHAKIEALKKERRTLYPKIKAEHVAVNRKYFAKTDKLFAERKKARLTKAAAKKGVPSLGPNDPVRRNVMQDLDKEMRRGNTNKAWIAKRKSDVKAEKAARHARSETLCTPGTYLAVEEAVSRAKRDAPGGDLRQKRWDYTGRIGVQLTGGKGLTVERALSGQDEKLKIEIREDVPLRGSKSDTFYPSHSRPVDLHAKERRARAKLFAREPERRPYRKAVMARIKISGHTTDAVYLDIHGVLHRPLPADGVIKWAYLDVDRVGYELVYELQLVMESKTFAIQREGLDSKKKLAVNFGWRVLPNDGHVRVATTWDGHESGHIILKADMLETDRFFERLIGHSDDHFDEVRDRTGAWLRELSAPDRKALTPLLRRAMPEHLRDELTTIKHIAAYMARWRGHERLVKVANVLRDLYLDKTSGFQLWSKWRKYRLRVRKDLFAHFAELSPWLEARGVKSVNAQMAFYLEAWRRKDRHLVNWARDTQTKLARHRREIYRTTAASWAKEYGQVAIEKWDKSKTAETPKYEEDLRVPQEENANSIRQFAGIYRCAIALKEKFGPDLIETAANDISREHFGCGGSAVITNAAKPGLSPTPELTCSKCERPYDQDVNAAKHLWHRAFGGGSEQAARKEHSERSGKGKKSKTSRRIVRTRDDDRNLEAAAE